MLVSKLRNFNLYTCKPSLQFIIGNSWGVCANGSQGMGCGAQEHFRTCSDISII